MPRGGSRPGAGAPKGNFNGVKGGAYSRRMRFALAALLSVPEYRLIFKFLHTAGTEAHRDFTELLLASTRVIYDRPVTDELRDLIDRAASEYIARVGPVNARRAVREHVRSSGATDLLRARKRISRSKLSANNPIFQEFARQLTGVDFAAGNQPPQPSGTPVVVKSQLPESEKNADGN